MYTPADVVEFGKAQEVIQGLIKDWLLFDDWEHLTFWTPEEVLDD